MTSKHYTRDRADRERIIKAIGDGTVVKTVVVDKGHKNGPEVHEIRSTALIYVYNQRTGKLITKLVARVGQIKRYYTNGETAPKDLLKKARYHTDMGWNN